MINDRMDVNEWLGKQLETAEPDLLGEVVRALAETLMSADADEVCGAPYGGGVTGSGQPKEWLSDPPLGHPGEDALVRFLDAWDWYIDQIKVPGG